jgi:HPt (histidine-containing phosphotransfer) domain-containing protein
MTRHESLALIDRAAIMRLSKEVDESLIPEIGGLFLVELDSRIKDATAALENDQLEVVKRSLHAIVGSAGSFGARQLVAVIRQIEKICDPAHEELLVQFMRVLDDVAAKTAGRLSAELSSIRMGS